MKLRYVISLLRTMNIPGFFPIMKDWQAFVRFHFIYAAVRSGLLQALATPCARDDLENQLNVKRGELLDALLDVGVSLRELSCDGGVYRIRGKRSKAVAGSNGDMISAMIEANVSYYASVYRKAAERLEGAPLGDELKEIGGVVARFSKIADPIIRSFVADSARGKGAMRILDVGCGSGLLLKTIYEANPDASGAGIDVDEEVVRQAEANMDRWGLQDRFEIISGDIGSAVQTLEGGFDLITLINVIYYFEPFERLGLLKTLASLLSPDGVLVLVTHIRSRGRDLGAANLNMVNCSLQGLAGLPELDELAADLERSGFRSIRKQKLIPGGMFFGISGIRGE